MGIRSFVGGLVGVGLFGRPHRAAPTQVTEETAKPGVRAGTEPRPYTVGEVLWFPRRAMTAQGALSGAGSAERGAGQFGFCPMREECNTAQGGAEV